MKTKLETIQQATLLILALEDKGLQSVMVIEKFLQQRIKHI